MNDKYARGRGRHPHGEDHPDATLTADQVRAIRKTTAAYEDVAAEYNVTPATIGDIKSRRSWRHLPPEKGDTQRNGGSHRGMKGATHYNASIQEADVLAIRASMERGSALARQYGVSPQTITDIRKRRSWRHLV